jgi:hypothetical protein
MHSKIRVLVQRLKLVFELRKGKRSTGTIIPNLNLVPSVCGKAGLTCSFLFSFGFRVWCIHLTIFFPCPWSFQGGVTSGRLGREI